MNSRWGRVVCLRHMNRLKDVTSHDCEGKVATDYDKRTSRGKRYQVRFHYVTAHTFAFREEVRFAKVTLKDEHGTEYTDFDKRTHRGKRSNVRLPGVTPDKRVAPDAPKCTKVGK